MFNLSKHQTSIKTEIMAGIITFLTMAYIIVVNPVILGDAGVPFEQAFTATIIAAVVGTLCMALFANLPIAIAPGMGLNAYFAYSVVKTHEGMTFAIAFSAVFVAGMILILLSLTSFRTKLLEAIPENLRHAITAGIGLFIAFIGLRLTGIVTKHPTNLVGLGDLHSPPVLLALAGLGITLVLMSLNVNGALFIGMLLTGVIAYFTGQLTFSNGITSLPGLPEGVIVSNPITAFSDVINYGLYGVVFSLLLVTLFDTTGTLLGVAQQGGFMKDGKLPNAGRALLSDSISATVGSMFGTTPTTAYIESSAGVAAGGRTGLTTLTVAILFAIAAFFGPLVGAVSGVAAITSPSLIIVGSLMMGAVRHIDWDAFDEAFPAFLVILTMPLTSSIATGIALGFISYPLMKVAKGQFRAVHPLLYVFGILFAYQLVFLPH
ncbi:guanine permease [Bacillus sp. AFS018417]|uniref:NCS2 family permease n=1 Tax=Bacillus sp. AFS018417 TaxID=2033491 RepID=UPI000BF3421D|nr:NCS2 family permease [Bacillus sp. AFS018417]PEZ07531.1 guanine permease [Bacillus sp. AFS018417]